MHAVANTPSVALSDSYLQKHSDGCLRLLPLARLCPHTEEEKVLSICGAGALIISPAGSTDLAASSPPSIFTAILLALQHVACCPGMTWFVCSIVVEWMHSCARTSKHVVTIWQPLITW